MLTTTAIDVDEELLNRCLVLSVNESREQTAAIHARQRQKQTLEGLLQRAGREQLTQLHHNAQRLLASVAVVNPYANELTFLADKTRARRDHMKYLTLINAITLLHQHQRELNTAEHAGQVLRFIEVTLDELPPQTRKLLVLARAWVQQQCQDKKCRQSELRFTRRQLRDAVSWGDTQLKVHLARLVDLEYLALHRRGLAHEYELLYDAKDDDRAHVNGLIDVSTLKKHEYDSNRSGLKLLRSASGRPSVGGWSAIGRGSANEAQSRASARAAADGHADDTQTRIKAGGLPALAAVVAAS